jgi:hypothetical protein
MGHSVCSGGLDIAELCASTPIHMVGIIVFGRLVILQESNGFDLFSNGKCNSIKDMNKIFSLCLNKIVCNFGKF